jgi:hypothetical protein
MKSWRHKDVAIILSPDFWKRLATGNPASVLPLPLQTKKLVGRHGM